MRCAIRDEEGEGFWIFARVFEIGDGEVGHGIGFIGLDVDAFKFVFVIKSLVIAVVEVVGCPIVVKSQSVRAWGHELIGGILVKISGLFINFAFGCVNVPFADVGTIHAVLRQCAGKRWQIGAGTQFVHDVAIGGGITARKEGCAMRAAHGIDRGGVDKVDAFR